MTRSDIGVISIIYATCILFCYMTLQLKPAAQIYPLCLIGGLALLNTLYLAVRGWQAWQTREKGGVAIANDLPEVFQGFQPRQFFFVVCACIAFMGLLQYLGFYLTSIIYLAGVMLWLRVKLLPLCITVVVLAILVYAVFTEFLNVPLPAGSLFE